MKYDPDLIEQKWQNIWANDNTFKVDKSQNLEKFYILEMFPYPSGKIHMGHIRNYAIGDVIARFYKMKGYNVLHPMGWDAFGLPAENAAINNNIHPGKWTHDNISYMKKQLKRLGLSYDWDREITTCNPSYYKWEQKFFIEMYKKGIAYKKIAIVNWCPHCNTVLANEQVEEGLCWRCGSLVNQKELESWYLKITDYAERLLDDMQKLKDWPERVISMQKNWIGKSVGAEIIFKIASIDESLTVFTTRPDTIFGATFMAIAVEHPLTSILLEKSNKKEQISSFINKVFAERKEIENFDKEKSGFFTGFYATNPATNKNIPIYLANFVLVEYGTGAIMGVPAHDQRDFEFAKKYDIEIIPVIKPKSNTLSLPLKAAYTETGILINSQDYNGLDNEIAKEKIIDSFEKMNIGKKKTHFKLRDWGISRQRYWGTPIPILYCNNCGTLPINEEDLPIILPDNISFSGSGNPLNSIPSFINTTCPVCGRPARRDTDTMDTFVESSWYFMRFCSARCDNRPFEEGDIKYWMPVDQYIGGIEHAILHLLYARFFTKVLKDLGYIDFDEPFMNLLTQGMVCKETYKCEEHGWLFPVEVKDNKCIKCNKSAFIGRIEKMSKSKKNVIDPDYIINKYGADTARLFVLFASPPEKDLEWSDEGIEGSHRFLNRVFRLILNNISIFETSGNTNPATDTKTPQTNDILYNLHLTIRKVTEDINKFQLNTAIAFIMEYTNFLYSINKNILSGIETGYFKNALETLIVLLSPFCPHICEELWQITGHISRLANEKVPVYNNDYIKKEEIIVVVQVCGKVRAEISVNINMDKEDILKIARENQKISTYIKNKKIIKEIYVPKKLVNFVVE